jgi:hypothetical protein
VKTHSNQLVEAATCVFEIVPPIGNMLAHPRPSEFRSMEFDDRMRNGEIPRGQFRQSYYGEQGGLVASIRLPIAMTGTLKAPLWPRPSDRVPPNNVAFRCKSGFANRPRVRRLACEFTAGIQQGARPLLAKPFIS